MNNPYSAPNAALSDPASEDAAYQPKIFSIHGRIGRLRYLAYTFFLLTFCLMAIGIMAAILIPKLAGREGMDVAGAILIGLLYVPIFAVTLIMAKRRFNDLDRSGWLALLMLVPVINFFCGMYLIFGPGSAETNRYGVPPTKNPALVIIAGLLLPLLFAVGTLAAIAVPAYQAFKVRAMQGASPASTFLASTHAGLML